MSSKNETPVLIASLVITVAILGGGYWWLTRGSGLDIGIPLGNNGGSTPSVSPTTSTPSSAPDSTSSTSSAPATASGSAAQFADVEGVPSGLFSYGGSTTWAPIRGIVDPDIQQAYPSFQLRYVDPVGAPPGSGTGIDMLLNNQLSFAQSSRPLTQSEREQAQQQGYRLKEIPVALEGIAIAVNPELPVDGVTTDQLRDIYLGNLTNWNQLGGPDRPIRPISRSTAGGTVEFFVNNVLGGNDLASSVTNANSTTEALRLVSQTPGSIYFASAPEVVGQCTVKPIAIGPASNQLVAPYTDPYVEPENCPNQRNQINTQALKSGEYPLTRRLFVVVREDGQTDQQAGEAYAELLLTQEGQQLLNNAGFVAIR